MEGETRLLPGTHAEVHVIGVSGRQLVRSRIVWAKVLAVSPLIYEAALCFDAEVVLLAEGYRIPGVASTLVGHAGFGYPSAGEVTGDSQESQGKKVQAEVGSRFEVSPANGLGRQCDGDNGTAG